MKDKGTSNAIYIMNIREPSTEKQKNPFLYFIDYEKTSDKMQHEPLLHFLARTEVDGKDLRLLRN